MKNQSDYIFQILNKAPLPTDARDVLINSLRSFADEINQNPQKSIEISYAIAGLMATEYAQHLAPNDPIDEILTIAGELEINPPNADSLRHELVQKIRELA